MMYIYRYSRKKRNLFLRNEVTSVQPPGHNERGLIHWMYICPFCLRISSLYCLHCLVALLPSSLLKKWDMSNPSSLCHICHISLPFRRRLSWWCWKLCHAWNGSNMRVAKLSRSNVQYIAGYPGMYFSSTRKMHCRLEYFSWTSAIWHPTF